MIAKQDGVLDIQYSSPHIAEVNKVLVFTMADVWLCCIVYITSFIIGNTKSTVFLVMSCHITKGKVY